MKPVTLDIDRDHNELRICLTVLGWDVLRFDRSDPRVMDEVSMTGSLFGWSWMLNLHRPQTEGQNREMKRRHEESEQRHRQACR